MSPDSPALTMDPSSTRIENGSPYPEIRVRWRPAVDRAEWDHALEALGGTFYHCHDEIGFETSCPGLSPVFLEAFAGSDLVGMAGSVLATPRWPILSRVSREATMCALPATRIPGPHSERAVLEAFEKSLRSLGVFRLNVRAYASPNSASVLASLGYATTERYGFPLNLAVGMDAMMASLHANRRRNLRKAMNNKGLTVEKRDDFDSVVSLLELNHQALSRKGVGVGDVRGLAQRVQKHLIQPARVTLLVCQREKEPVAALAFGTFGGQGNMLFSGSSLEGNQVNAPVMLYWKMFETLIEQGATLVDLGGVTTGSRDDPMEDGLFRFKSGFGAEPVPQPSGVKILSELGAMGNEFRLGCKRFVDRLTSSKKSEEVVAAETASTTTDAD